MAKSSKHEMYSEVGKMQTKGKTAAKPESFETIHFLLAEWIGPFLHYVGRQDTEVS